MANPVEVSLLPDAAAPNPSLSFSKIVGISGVAALALAEVAIATPLVLGGWQPSLQEGHLAKVDGWDMTGVWQSERVILRPG